MAENRGVVIGLDYGTTQSTACFFDVQKNTTEIIIDSTASSQYASMLAFETNPRNPNEMIQFGNMVKNNPSISGVIREVKRFIGKKYDDLTADILENPIFNIEKGEQGEIEFIVIDQETGEELKFTPEELIAIQLVHIKKIISNRCKGADFSKVVMTVPPSFDQTQIKMMQNAYELAGIQPMTIIKEPSAAIYEYHHLTQNESSKILVIDIGGGTTDVCICEQNGIHSTIKGNGGDSMLGGSDFDKIMMDLILNKLDGSGYPNMANFKQIKRRETALEKRERSKNINKLKQEAEKAKIHLSTHQEYQLDFDTLLPRNDGFDVDIIITREEYEKLIVEDGIIERLGECIDNCFKKSRISKNTIQLVVLVGGVTHMPIVRRMIEHKFGANKISTIEEYNPLNAVAKGACRYANVYAAGRDASEDIHEYIPESIGIEIYGGRMKFIAQANQITPVDWSHQFHPGAEGSTTITFELLRGDSEYANWNEPITTYSVSDLDPSHGRITVTFDVYIEKNGNMIMKAKQNGVDKERKSERISCGFKRTDKDLEFSRTKIAPYF